MGSQYAGTLGMIALVATVIRSGIHGVDPGTTIVTSIMYLAAFSVFGWLVGSFATHVVVQSVTETLERELAEREASKSFTAASGGN